MVSNGSSQDERLLWFLRQPKFGPIITYWRKWDKQTTKQMEGQNCEDKAVFYSLSEQEIHKGLAINTGTYNGKLKLDLSISNIGMYSPPLIHKGNNLQ